jgi:UDP-3-O-[3-hydroxymyristoyl] glucosamine N-acyltransferase
VIAAGAVIGPEVRIGRDCAIGANATITHALIGDRVIVHPGARIGQRRLRVRAWAAGPPKVPQLRARHRQDNVEIGANSTIDRGSIRDTVIRGGPESTIWCRSRTTW